MLNSELEFYLKTNFGPPRVDFQLSDDENAKLFTFLDETCYEGCLQETENQQKVKQAFKEFFEPVGYILFKITDNRIFLKVFPYRIEPKDSVNLPAVLEILEKNKDLIEYNYKNNENQIAITTPLKNKIFHFINKINNEEINKKELARYAVNEFFNLREHDIVIIREQYIFVKKLDPSYKRAVNDNEKNTVANRFNGINEDELKSIYDDFFAKEENKNFFYYTAKLFVKMYMLDKKIDNYFYEQKVFSLIQSIIAEQMNNTYNRDQDFCTGFAGFIFRNHFEEVFGHIANFILAEVAISNEYMINFVKYYSSNVVVIDGKRYKVPELETHGGRKWNVVTMLSIVKIYTKTKNSIDKLQKEKEEFEQKVNEMLIEGLSPIDFQNHLADEIGKLNHVIIERKQKIEKLSLTLKSSPSKNDAVDQFTRKEIVALKEEIQKHTEERARLEAKHVPKNVIIQYTNVRKELDSIIKHLHRDEKILAQNTPSYLSIKYALTKALISKKSLIG